MAIQKAYGVKEGVECVHCVNQLHFTYSANLWHADDENKPPLLTVCRFFKNNFIFFKTYLNTSVIYRLR